MSRPRRTLRRVPAFLRLPVQEMLLTVLMFGYLYNVVLAAVPMFSTGRVSFVILLMQSGSAGLGALRAYARRYWWVLVLLAGVLGYGALLSTFSGETTQLSRIVHFIAFVVVGGVLWGHTCEWSYLRFVRLVASAAAVQASLIFISAYSPEYRGWLASVAVQGGNLDLLSSLQAPGFSNGGGAALAVIQASGVFAALGTAERTSGITGRLAWTFLALVILASTVPVGRTGILLGAFVVLLFFVASNGARGTLLTATGAVVLAVLMYGAVSEQYLRNSLEQFDRMAAWVASAGRELVGQEEGSLGQFQRMPIPPLGTETLLGTGRVIAASGYGNASGHDSGYIQAYYALGLPVAALFYFTLLLTLRAVLAGSRNAPLWGFAASMFLVEIKEPFIFKYSLPFVILTAALLSPRQAAGIDRLTKPLRRREYRLNSISDSPR